MTTPGVTQEQAQRPFSPVIPDATTPAIIPNTQRAIRDLVTLFPSAEFHATPA